MANPMFNFQQQVRQNQEDIQDFLRDLNTWEQKIKVKDQQLSQDKDKEASVDNKQLPPIRNQSTKPSNKESKKLTTKQKDEKAKPARISSYDYRSWDKFNIDEALSHVSDEEKEDVDNENETANDDGNDEESVEILQQKAQFQKNKGNELFKIGKYEEAIKCYACGIEADPWNAIIYANRAMALLKLKRYSEAEKDCTSCIAIDKSYAKAYSRRGTARAALKQFNDAVNDFQEVLKLEPGNKLALSELQKIRSKLNPTNDKKSMNKNEKQKTAKQKKEEPLRRIPIEEIGSDEESPSNPISENKPDNKESTEVTNDDQNNSTTELPPKAETISKVPTVPLRTKAFNVPTTSFQFESDWKEICHSSQLLYEYLQIIQPKLYPRLFQESLDSEKLIKMMNVFLNHYIPNNRSVIEELLSISKVKRFSIVLLFLSSDEKKIINDLFKLIQESMLEASDGKYTLKDVQKLASTYNVK